MKQYLPMLLSLALVYGCGNTQKPEPVAAKTPAKTVTHYELATAEAAGLSQYINLPAQLAAYQEVSIFPRVNGYVKEVYVDIGSRVKKGQPLMLLEAPELMQQAMQARERYERAGADFALARENYERLLQASKTLGAVAPLTLATARSKMSSDSALCNAEKANWQMQQTIMSYLKVNAPFSGVITDRNVHPGALINAGDKLAKPMLDLKDIDRLRLQVDIPEAVSTNLSGHDTVSFFVNALPGKKMVAHIARQASSINPQFRSERVEMDVDNRDGKLSPGMYASVRVLSKGNLQALAVPRSAVITSTERKYVMVVRDGKAVKVDVVSGNESADRVEVTGNLKAGDKLLLHPSDEMKDGMAIHQG